jgi:hypothetical protein
VELDRSPTKFSTSSNEDEDNSEKPKEALSGIKIYEMRN